MPNLIAVTSSVYNFKHALLLTLTFIEYALNAVNQGVTALGIKGEFQIYETVIILHTKT
jgi:hypothetical protein